MIPFQSLTETVDAPIREDAAQQMNFSREGSFSAPIPARRSKLVVKMDSEIRIIQAAETYKGDYTVIPSDQEQTLYTDKKLMADNVTVKEIPSYAVANQYGTTIIIG